MLVWKILESEEPITIHADSTTRSHSGKQMATPVSVGHKLQLALPMQHLNRETTEDVVDVLELQYDRMAHLNQVSGKEMYEGTDASMFDSASENENAPQQLQIRMGSDHRLLHLKCTLHASLAFTAAMTKVISAIEESIGSDKLYLRHILLKQSQVSVAKEHYYPPSDSPRITYQIRFSRSFM